MAASYISARARRHTSSGDLVHRRDFARSLAATLGALAASPDLALAASRARRAAPRVNGARLNAHLTELSAFGRNPQGGVSRVAYSDADRDGRAYVVKLLRDAGLEVRTDAAANIFGRRAGTDRSLAPILIGSHTDSVPEGGNYDGDVGSLGAIEVAQTLGEAKVALRHPLDVVIWSNEEGGLVGSRAALGELEPRELALVSNSGKTIGDGIRFLGGDPDRLASARIARGDVAAYVELHIEQGGTLERERIDIGVVEGIVGIDQWEVTVEGLSNHAGTTPMDQRRDALLAAARFVEMVNRVVRSVPGRQVGTVGRIQAFPGAPNVIPGKVVCSLELRDLDAAKIHMLFDRIRAESDAIAKDGGVTFAFRPTIVNVPAPTDPRVRAVIADAAKSLGLTTKVMPSGAGHDAQDLARLAPTGMIFIPSVGGISHSPKELSRPQDIENGANVLLETVLRLDRTI
jgi:beta-ureidopropionase / N-carbamoyl-L-amino-acid hydrolase